MSARTISVVEDLARNFPGLRPVLDEHKKANFGEVLPHLFMGELTEIAASEFVTSSSDISRRRQLQNLLQWIENIFKAGDKEVQNLILVSFLENLPWPDEEGGDIAQLLGQTLKEELAAIR